MAHELTIREDGKAEAFYAGNGKELKPAWHDLGTNVLDAPNSAAAIKLAGLDWEVGKVTAGAVGTDPRDGMNLWVEATDAKAIIRKDNNRVLGFVTDRYHPVQNVQAFDFLDALNQDGIVKYESAGSLYGGKSVWVLARTNSVFEIAPGDNVQPYILFSTTHDGTGSIRVMPTPVRVVCNNTLRVALGRYGVGLTLRHDGTVGQRIKAVKEILALAISASTEKLELARKMVEVKVEKDAFAKFVDDILPINPDSERPGMRVKAREEVAWNYYSNPRQNLPGIARTAWAAYNAVSEFADHAGKFRGAESRFTSIFEGGADALKQKAFDRALAIA